MLRFRQILLNVSTTQFEIPPPPPYLLDKGYRMVIRSFYDDISPAEDMQTC